MFAAERIDQLRIHDSTAFRLLHTAYYFTRSRMDPLSRSVAPIFFLPDRHNFFEPVDEESSRVERLMSMRATDGNRNTDIAEFQVSQPMHDSRLDHRPASASFRFEFSQLGFGHLRVRIVIERDGLPTVSHLTHGSEKQHDRASLIRANGFGQRGEVDRFVSELDHR